MITLDICVNAQDACSGAVPQDRAALWHRPHHWDTVASARPCTSQLVRIARTCALL